MTPPSPSLSSSSTRCLLVAMVTSPSVPPYGEAGRLEDILEKNGRREIERENSEQYSKDDIRGSRMELHDGVKVPVDKTSCCQLLNGLIQL